jgi:hypothetical protein
LRPAVEAAGVIDHDEKAAKEGLLGGFFYLHLN